MAQILRHLITVSPAHAGSY